MQTLKVTWDGLRPPSNVSQVWTFLTQGLRDIKDTMRNASEDFYGKSDRLTYLSTVHDAIKTVCDCAKEDSTVSNYLDVEKLLLDQSKSNSHHVIKAHQVLQAFSDKLKIAVGRIADVKVKFAEDILCPLETYCSKYTKLGISDDEFFKTLQSRTISIRGILGDFNKLSAGVRQAVAISCKYFSDNEFSQEVAMEFDCEMYPVLRIMPDLTQKLDSVINIAQDWLRSDKVYLEALKRQIDKTRENIKECDKRALQNKHEYCRMFSMLKQKQAEVDETDDTNEALWKEINRLETKKTRMEMEVVAVAKTLRNCRDQLRDLHSAEQSYAFDDEYDDVDGEIPEKDMEFEMTNHRRTGKGHAHSSYRSRLCHDARGYSAKLDYLRKKKKRIEKRILQKRQMIQDMECTESEIHSLSKAIKAMGRKKNKLIEELDLLHGNLESLEVSFQQRLHPELCVNMKKPPMIPGRKTYGLKKTKPKSKKPLRNSAELHKAFRIVKNSIGHNWKDLARILPYGSSKPLTEINNEIKVIEYENQGQLKEQAYQSLARWHAYVGRRASVDRLKHALKELNENRIAEKVDVVCLGEADSLSTGSGSGC